MAGTRNAGVPYREYVRSHTDHFKRDGHVARPCLTPVTKALAMEAVRLYNLNFHFIAILCKIRYFLHSSCQNTARLFTTETRFLFNYDFGYE